MTRSILILACLFIGLYAQAQEKINIRGKLWSEGQELNCNWYVKKGHIVLELISMEKDPTNMRFHFITNSHQMTAITKSSNGTVRNVIHKDSIIGSFDNLLLKKNGVEKDIESIGICKRYQAKTTLFEALAYSKEIPHLDLKLIEGFLKNDPVLSWFSTNNPHEFPIQYVVSKSNGDLLISFITESIVNEFDTSVFESN